MFLNVISFILCIYLFFSSCLNSKWRWRTERWKTDVWASTLVWNESESTWQADRQVHDFTSNWKNELSPHKQDQYLAGKLFSVTENISGCLKNDIWKVWVTSLFVCWCATLPKPNDKMLPPASVSGVLICSCPCLLSKPCKALQLLPKTQPWHS